MRSRLLPLLGPEEIVTCRPRSAFVHIGWLLAITGMGAVPIVGIMLVGGVVSLLTSGSFLPFLISEVVAVGIASFAFSLLRIAWNVFFFDCIVTDMRLCWYNGPWQATPQSCRIMDVAKLTTQVIILYRATFKMVTVTLNRGHTLRLFGLESEREFFEALGFEYPPPKSGLWKPAQARRRVF